MNRFLCLHGHFYQPPRENPWIEAIETQESARPYHDWNERITAECYAPNAAARILDDQGRIVRIVNNYRRISFNFGPTLLDWLRKNDLEVYHAIRHADRESHATFQGHGSALAQCYNHIIMPLANERDKRTQVLWGLRDFEFHFGRKAEGMWLPETAVDLATLEVLAANGIAFTLLAPHQARRFRKIGETLWTGVSGALADTSRPYRITLPSGGTLALFFYDGPTSKAIAFEGLLSSGVNLANRLMAGFRDSRKGPQLVHVATDGETYGHHHQFGEMALAYALQHIESQGLATLTNYGAFLEQFPPEYEVEIFENTAWSCAHGIERWRNDCGCQTGGQPGWNQKWRAPLRKAFDWLRDDLAPLYEEAAGRLLRDPWLARDEYIDVVLDRSAERVQTFLDRHTFRPLEHEERVTVLKLLEMQRDAMLMYTSCGWFFSDPSGIETVQCLQYAGRALQLAKEVFGDAREQKFLDLLSEVKSNLQGQGKGRQLFEKHVQKARVDLPHVGAHFAVRSLLEETPQPARIYSYHVDLQDFHRAEGAQTSLLAGRSVVTSEITGEREEVVFGFLRFEDQSLNGGVAPFRGEAVYLRMVEEAQAAVNGGDATEVVRVLDRYFGELTWSLDSLLGDEQRRIVGKMLEETMAELEASYREIYRTHAALIQVLNSLKLPIPESLRDSVSYVLNADLRRALGAEWPDIGTIRRLLKEAETHGATLDKALLSFTCQHTLERLAGAMDKTPRAGEELEALVGLSQELLCGVNLWKVQNRFWELPAPVQRALGGLEEKLKMRVG